MTIINSFIGLFLIVDCIETLRRKFFTNLLLLLFLNLIIKPVWVLGIDLSVQNRVGEAEYGFYFSLFGFSLLLNILLDFGINSFTNREISQNQHLLKKYLSNIVVLKFLLAAVYILVIASLSIAMKYSSRQLNLLAVLAFNQILASFVLYFRANISGMQFFKTDSLLSVLDRFLMILICAVLLWGNVIKKEFKIEWFVYAQSLSYFITLLVSGLIVLRKSGLFKLNFDKKLLLSLLKKTYPFALLALLMQFYFRSDSVMLERLLPDGDHQAGVYAQAYRLLDAFTMFAVMFSQLLLPMFSAMFKKKESVNKLTEFSFLLMIVPVISLAVPVFFYKEEIMQLLYRDPGLESSKILGVLMFSFMAIASSYIFGTLLTAHGNLKELNVIAGISALLSLLLNLYFIPRYQAVGAAYASVITQIVSIGLQLILVKKKLCFFIQKKHLVKLLFYTFLLIAMGKGFTFIQMTWFIEFALFLILSVLFAFSLKVFSIRLLTQILIQEKDLG